MTVTFPLPPRAVVKNTLEANGFGWISNPLLDPVEDWTKLPVLHRRGAAVFGDNLLPPEFASYEFRKLLRYLINSRGGTVCDVDAVAATLSQNSASVAKSFEVLETAGLLEREGQYWVFVPTVDSLGPTLEWYVASLFNKHLHWAASSNVYLEDIAFNDFDVLAVRGNEIAHVECKTSAPGNVPESDLVALTERHYFLEPAFTLLLIDTSSSVGELASRLEDVISKRFDAPVAHVQPVDQKGNVFNGMKNIYIGNASKGASNGLLRTLQLTLRHYSTRVRGKMFWG